MPTFAEKKIRGSLLGSAAILSLVVGCAAFFPETPRGSGWIEHRLAIDEREFLVRVPPENHGLHAFPVIPRVNLARALGSNAPKSSVMMLEKRWDFKGWFWQGTRGIVNMAVSVIRKDASYPHDLSTFDLLQDYIQYEFKRDFKRFLEKVEREGNMGYAHPGPPEGFERVTMGQAEWLKYHSEDIVTPELRKEIPKGSETNSDTYVLPLSSSHYLLVNFIFSDTSMSRGYTSTWRQEAAELAEQIKATIQWK